MSHEVAAVRPVALGIEQTSKFLEELQELTVGLVKVVKKRQYLLLLGLIGDVKGVIESAPRALPELSDLTADEVGDISAKAYVLVRSVIAAIVSA